MKIEKKDVPSIATMFIARRIAEFPTLYSHGDQVIYNHVIGREGSSYWDKNGILQNGDSYYNPKTKKFTKYPLKISMEVALKMTHSFGKSLSPYYEMSGPINSMPLNIEDSWLLEIFMFLNKWGKFSIDDFKMMAVMHCMLHYGVKENPNAYLPQRTIDDFTKFHAKIPSWQAEVQRIYHYKQFKRVDPKTYMGIDI
jgi:hypothetical protein